MPPSCSRQTLLVNLVNCTVATLKASQLGLARIQQARKERGWRWNEDDDTCFIQASQILEPERDWSTGGPYAYGVSLGTWKRFLAGKVPISARTFQAYCQILGLQWDEVVERRGSNLAPSQQDWDEAIDVSTFYGRTTELQELEQWVVGDRCRLVVISGIAGIGKTNLSVKLARQLQDQFTFVLRRSLRQGITLPNLLHDCITFLGDQPETPPQEPLGYLLEVLRTYRCLIILDDVETLLRSGQLAGQYREGYQAYSDLITRLGQERHQSCLLLITREKPREISSLAGQTLPIRDFQLGGLDVDSAHQILQMKGVKAQTRGTFELIQLYRGHPLALKLMATTIQDIFGGQIYEFLNQSTLVLGDVMPGIFHDQLQRLSPLEQAVINWLALANDPVSLQQLRQYLRSMAPSTSVVVATLESLKRRSLLEMHRAELGGIEFSLEPVLMKYVTGQLTNQFYEEIMSFLETGDLEPITLLKTHCLAELSPQKKWLPRQWLLHKLTERFAFDFSLTTHLHELVQTAQQKLAQKPEPELGYLLLNLKILDEAL